MLPVSAMNEPHYAAMYATLSIATLLGIGAVAPTAAERVGLGPAVVLACVGGLAAVAFAAVAGRYLGRFLRRR